jgi:hypothetical protein
MNFLINCGKLPLKFGRLDAANGVGANKVKLLIPYLENLLQIDLKNDGTTGKLNYQVRHVCQPPKF